MKVKRNNAIDAADLRARLEAAHAPPEWAIFFEVANGTGSVCRRHADAVAMSLWPSRGLTIRGFEIKVSRSDYKREAADPEKAETVARFCDEWWIVTPVDLIRDPELELPPAWGLMVANPKGGLKTVRKAATTKAKPISRPFLAAMLRRAHESLATQQKGWVRREDIAEQIAQAEARGAAQVPRDMQHLQRDADAMRKVIKDWKDATGIDLHEHGWHANVGRIVERYRLGQAMMGEKYGDTIGSTLKQVEHARHDLAAIARALEALTSTGDSSK